MSRFLMMVLIVMLCFGCGADNTEQTRTTVSDYNVYAGGNNQSLQTDNSLESTNLSSSNSTSTTVEGSWKLVSSSGGYPHAVGSSLMISDNTFSLTQPSASGNYSIQGGTFSFDFGGGMVIRFTYTISGNTLSFTGIDYDMNMVYSRN